MVRELNGCYQSSPVLWCSDYDPGGFQWLIIDDRKQSVFAFFRASCKARLVVICNMTPVVRHHYRVGVPEAVRWREIFNTDRVEYQGSGVINETIDSEGVALHQQQTLVLTLPPLATLFLSPDR
ncbi:MAG: alpha amylase C-terminal domain-containing protein [Endozoicomonas sp.]